MEHRLRTTVAAALIALGITACGGGGGGGALSTPSGATPGETGSSSPPPPAPPSGETGSAGTGSSGATPDDANTGASGSSDGASGSASPTGSTSTGDGTSGTAAPPMQAAAFGPITVASNAMPPPPSPASQQGPVATRLANGGTVIVWISGAMLLAQQLDGSGNKVGPVQTVSSLPGSLWSFSVTGLKGGDWVVAWSAQTIPVVTPRAMPYTIQTKRYSASGAVVQDTTALAGVSFFAVDPRLQVKATPDGGYVLGWCHSEGTIYLASFQRFDSVGNPFGSIVPVGAVTGDQTRIQVAPQLDGSVAIAWLQSTPVPGGATFEHSIYSRRFDSAGNPLANARRVAESVATAKFAFAAAALANGNLALAWVNPIALDSFSMQARWQVLGPDGSPITSMGSHAMAPVLTGVDIAPAGSGFTAFVQVESGTPRGSLAHIDTLVIDANGARIGGATIAARQLFFQGSAPAPLLGPAAADFSVASAGDGRYVAAYETGVAGGVAEVNALGQ
jgi:hypothetical protein